MPSIIIRKFQVLFIKYSYLYGIHTIITYLLTDEEIETEVTKLPAQSLTASNRNQTHVIGLLKVIMYLGYCSFVAIAKRKYVDSCDGLENLYGEGMTGFIVPKK